MLEGRSNEDIIDELKDLFKGDLNRGFSNYCENINFQLSPDDEGRILFFPAWLQHMVYPFYECEKERVTISGNIALEIPNISFNFIAVQLKWGYPCR